MADDAQEPRAADTTPGRRAVDDDKPWGEKHHDIVKLELEAINSRREAPRRIPTEEIKSGQTIDVVGLALSGGGIRSSAICLGVLQALNQHDLIKRIDYLSTVSGGGYIGSSLSATMTKTGKFVFGERSTAGSPAEISDTPAVGHLRNYSNYLIPAGARDLLTGTAIVVRGLVANLSLTVPLILLLAAITIGSNPARSCLYAANLFGIDVGNQNPFWSSTNWLVTTFAFTLAGMVTAVLAFVSVEILYLVFLRNGSKGFHVFGAYLAGAAVTMGAICDLAHFVQVRHFGLTLSASLLGLALFLVWALVRSRRPPNKLQEFRGQLPTMGATYLLLIAVIGFFEFQPFMIAEVFNVAEAGADQDVGVVASVMIGWIKSLAAITAPVAAAVTLFRQQFADLIKGAGASDLTSRILAYVAKAAVAVAGLALPLLIWIAYLYLGYWGVANDKVLPAEQRQCRMSSWDDLGMQPAPAKAAASLSGKIQFNSEARTLAAEIAGKEAAKVSKTKSVEVTSHIPGWLLSLASLLGNPDQKHWSIRSVEDSDRSFANNVNRPIAILYMVLAAALFAISWILTPNANSLHRLYRDRLSKAFLFNPDPSEEDKSNTGYKTGQPARNEPSMDQGRDFPDLDELRLSELCPVDPVSNRPDLKAPYHLINAALNIQGSDFANRRGRNADFFVFSPLRIGSEATRYAKTLEFEAVSPGLDVATAMAISGAAASSNMGSSSIKVLAPTLALLNVRLGYWLKNPRYVKAESKPPHRSTPLYLWSEITGRLYENAEAVYLTDGGHIENLGVYELLRRRCKVIIAVDAEADAAMNFSALMTLQRYARIDLGIRIDLPWTPIRTHTLAWMTCNAGKPASPPPVASDGPHVAIGVIDYGGGERGYLVYIKSSLTGDENDYIRDYARRHDSFPHESTGDQFFSEEQFEVYRALGFHITHAFLSGDNDVVAAADGSGCITARFTAAGVASIDAVRTALGLPVSPLDSRSGAMAPPGSE